MANEDSGWLNDQLVTLTTAREVERSLVDTNTAKRQAAAGLYASLAPSSLSDPSAIAALATGLAEWDKRQDTIVGGFNKMLDSIATALEEAYFWLVSNGLSWPPGATLQLGEADGLGGAPVLVLVAAGVVVAVTVAVAYVMSIHAANTTQQKGIDAYISQLKALSSAGASASDILAAGQQYQQEADAVIAKQPDLFTTATHWLNLILIVVGVVFLLPPLLKALPGKLRGADA